jgi:hypothetical protein
LCRFTIFSLIDLNFHASTVDACLACILLCSSSFVHNNYLKDSIEHIWNSNFHWIDSYSTRATPIGSTKLLWKWRLHTLQFWSSSCDYNKDNFSSPFVIRKMQSLTWPSTFSKSFWTLSFCFCKEETSSFDVGSCLFRTEIYSRHFFMHYTWLSLRTKTFAGFVFSACCWLA